MPDATHPSLAARPTARRVVVGVDADARSAHAVVRGASLARRLDAALELVHAVRVPPALWPGISAEQRAEMHSAAVTRSRAQALERLRAALDGSGAVGDLDELLVARPGPPAQVLLEALSGAGDELLVVGPHAQRKVFDFGSTARALLAHSAAPLWVQPEAALPVEHVLVAVDFSATSRVALEHAHALAARLGASLRVLHAFEPRALDYAGLVATLPGPVQLADQEREVARAELARWMDAFPWGDVRAEPLFVEGDAVDVVLEEAERCDLVVLGTHGHTGLARFLLGSVAYGVLQRARKPALVVPSESRDWQLAAPGA